MASATFSSVGAYTSHGSLHCRYMLQSAGWLGRVAACNAGGLAAPAIAAGFGAAVGMAGGAAGVAGAGAAGASFAGALGSTVGIVGIGGGIGVAGGNYVGAKTARRIADISVCA